MAQARAEAQAMETATAIRDMAAALAYRNCNSVNVFPNALKTVTVECR